MKAPLIRGITSSLLLGWALCVPATADADENGVRLINGKPVDPNTYKEVISIMTNNSGCTATVVGKRVIITAAHCATTGSTSTFKLNGVDHSAKMTRSSIYPGKDHDVAVGITNQDIGITPASIGGTATQGLGITLLGYGCVNPGGGGGNDGILRIGDSTIVGFEGYDMVSRKANGAALCFGDSGGPAFVINGNSKQLLGINSKGNIKDTNYNARLDSPESQDFLKNFAAQNTVEICGINSTCSGTPPPTPPTCQMAASPSLIKLGQSLMLSLVAAGQATGATIEGTTVGVPNGQINITPGQKGTFTARGTVTGPGGSGSCQTTYTVEENILPPVAPTCNLTATPNAVKVGETVTLEITTAGQVTKATIDGMSVAFPIGKTLVTGKEKGFYNVQGVVMGPGGTGNCSASYSVDDGGPLPPETPNLAVVPAYCGQNTLTQSEVSRVCLAVVKKDSSMMDLRLTDALLITYNDGNREVLPIISRRPRAQSSGDLRVVEDITVYANLPINTGNYMVLDSRTAMLTKTPPMARSRSKRGGEIPSAIEGRSAKGWYYIVDNLKAYAVSQ